MNAIRLIALTGALALTAGCGPELMPQDSEDNLGTLQLPLTATGDSGKRYMLKGQLSWRKLMTDNSWGQADTHTFGNGTSESWSTNVVPGKYRVRLANEGLKKKNNSGSYVDVPDDEVQLTSNRVNDVIIDPGETEKITYKFKVEGEKVDTTPGSLQIEIEIDDDN